MSGADFVDSHVAHVAHTISTGGLDRLVDEAITRHDPVQAQERREAAAEHRRFDLRFGDTGRIGATGTVQVDGSLEYGDARDLEAAVAHGAAVRAALGSTDPLGARRAAAVGELARRQLALDLNPDTDTEPTTPEADNADTDADTDADADDAAQPGSSDGAERADSGDQPPPAKPRQSAAVPPAALVRPRQVVVHVHLSAAALVGTTTCCCGHDGCDRAAQDWDGDWDPLARVENISSTGGYLGVDQVAAWCADPDTQVTITPVIDLNTTPRTDAYEIPDRIRHYVALRDRTCVFPGCGVNARHCDLDHTQPHDPDNPGGGDTCVCNLAPLCRRHHRLETTGGWTYRCLTPGVHQWTTKHGHIYQAVHRQHHHDPPEHQHEHERSA